jgi:hypothetical protein
MVMKTNGRIKIARQKEEKDTQQRQEARQAQATANYYLETSAFSCYHVLSKRGRGSREAKNEEESMVPCLKQHNNNSSPSMDIDQIACHKHTLKICQSHH